MKPVLLFFLLLFVVLQPAFCQAPVLGIYPATTIATADRNATVNPSATPVNATAVIAYTSSAFQGTLTVNPATGVLAITNANPAGIYSIQVVASNGTAFTTNTFTLVVNNTNCSQGLFSNASSVAVSSSKSVAIGDFNKDGHQDLAVINNSNVTISLGNGSGGFTGATNIAVATIPNSMVITDFNGDGNQDLAVASSYTNAVSIRLGNGAGAFTGTSNMTVSSTPYGLANADFNGDGKQDLAIGNPDANAISIRLGDGTANFTGNTEVTVGSRSNGVVTGDFNNDGKADFITSNSYGGISSIRLGNGSGGFFGTGTVNIGGTSDKMVIADINQDGNQDIISAISSGSFVSVRYGDGLGNFTGTTSLTLGFSPRSLSVADFNGDGKLDFAVANENQNAVSIRLGDGTGSFKPGNDINVGSSQYGLAVGDFNEDGKQDMAICSNYSSALLVRLGIPDLAEINVLGNSLAIADGETLPAAANYTDFGNITGYLLRIFTIQNTGSSGLPVNSIKLTGADTNSFKLSEISLPAIIPAGGSATFIVGFYPTVSGLKTVTVNIYNDDCDESLYDFTIQGTGVAAPPTVGSYLNTTLNTSANTSVVASSPPSGVVQITATTSANFKGVLAVNQVTGAVMVTNAHPAGNYLVTVKAFNAFAVSTTTFSLSVSIPLCSNALLTGNTSLTMGANPRSIGVGDFNGDGIQDLATSVATNTIAISLGNGNGGFTAAPNVVMSYSASYLAVGDLNGDGKQDLAILGNNTTSSNVVNLVTLLGNGAGAFTPGGSVSVGSGPISISLGDFNGDGRQDAAVPNYTAIPYLSV